MDRESIKQRKQMGFTNWCYAGQRIDLLIISISGGGIYIILETLKYSLDKPLNYIVLIKISGILFVASIISNLLSQLSGQEANDHDQQWCEKRLCASDPMTADEIVSIELSNSNASRYSQRTKNRNISSMIAMFAGLIFLIIFFLGF
jgi:hypothetical protein